MATPRLRRLRDQVMVVTGASSGIGLVTAQTAARRGARVMLVARNEEALRAAVGDIERDGGTAAYAIADVGVMEEVQAAAQVAVMRFGRIDTWVNNAGVAIYARLADTPMDEHERMLRTNYLGVVHGALAALPHLKTGGALITVGSIAGDMATPVMGAYAATKHAVAGYIRSLRVETIADGLPVAITLVRPSGIATPIADHAANHMDGDALLPPPIYDPQLVADAIVDAAENPRRDVIVGGAGRVQTIVAAVAPQLLDLAGAPLAKMLRDTDRPPQRDNNLDGSIGPHAARSSRQTGRRLSLYAQRGSLPLALAFGAIAMLAGSVRRR